MPAIPENLKYTTSHEWVAEEDGVLTVGLTDYAQNELGDLVFVNLPEEGDEATAGEAICDVESVKAVSDVYSPATGTVVGANEDLADAPESINSDPYGAWIVKIGDVTETEELMDAAAYAEFCENAEE